jgi:hypothetical protein
VITLPQPDRPARIYRKKVALPFAAELFEPAQSGDRALLDPAGIVPIGLNELDVAACSRGGDLHKYAATLSTADPPSMKRHICHDVPPHVLLKSAAGTRINTEKSVRKSQKIGFNCRTPVACLSASWKGVSLHGRSSRRYFGSVWDGSASHLLMVLRDKLVILEISRMDFFWRWNIRRTLPSMAMVITPVPR